MSVNGHQMLVDYRSYQGWHLYIISDNKINATDFVLCENQKQKRGMTETNICKVQGR